MSKDDAARESGVCPLTMSITGSTMRSERAVHESHKLRRASLRAMLSKAAIVLFSKDSSKGRIDVNVLD